MNPVSIYTKFQTVSISVIKVGIRCKEHLAAIKFIIYFFSIYVHHCTLIIKLSVRIRRKRQKSITKATVTNGHKNKIVGGLVRTLQLFSLYFQSKYKSVLAMFVGKYLLYEVQCVKHEHSTQIQCVYCSELRLSLIICSFCFSALLILYRFKNEAKLANKSHTAIVLH